MKKGEKDRQAIYKTLYRKLKIEQHRAHYKPGISTSSEWLSDCCLTPAGGQFFIYIIYQYSYKYLESDLIKHCHVIFIHSLGQPLIVRSHSKIHRSRGNPNEIPTWASRVSNYSYFPWFNRQQTWRPATGLSL
jgi:hypothetical protein